MFQLKSSYIMNKLSLSLICIVFLGLQPSAFPKNDIEAKDLSINPILKGIDPTDAGFVVDTSDPSPSIKIVDGIIQINSLSGQTVKWRADAGTNCRFSPANDYTIEFRVAVPINNGRGLDVVIRDGAFSYPLINISHEKFFGFTMNQNWYSLDSKRFHTYRLGVKRTLGEIYVWIDGVYKGRIVKSSDATSANFFEFGKGSVNPQTDIHLDYIAFDFSGMYKPTVNLLEEPDYIRKDMSNDLDLDGSVYPTKAGWSVYINPPPSIGYLFENNYHSESTIQNLTSEVSSVYVPIAADDWQYAHHPSIAYFKNKFVAIFSNGRYGEDESAQRVLTSTSIDANTWSNPQVLVDTDQNHVLTPGGLFVANDNLLVTYYTINDYDENQQYLNPKLLAMKSTDGVNWSEPIDLGISLFASHAPINTGEGKLLITGNKKIYSTSSLDGLSGWKLTENTPLNDSDVGKAGLVEGAFIIRSDSLYILYRDVIGKTFLWQQSSLNGEEWGVPKKTRFTNCNTKSHFGQLPDGRYYYVGTPDTLDLGARYPLILTVSNNGFVFNKNYVISDSFYQIKFPYGRWKGGQFGYPYSIIHDEHLYVIVSRRKEKIEVYKIPLSQLC